MGSTGGGPAGSAGVVGVGQVQPAVAGGAGAGRLCAGGVCAGVETGVQQSPHTEIGSRGGLGWFVAEVAAV
ncbi:MAG: hypothetical protein ACRDRL_30195 [Sciscionella sp.]